MKKLYSLLVVLMVATVSFGQITLVEDINPGTGYSSPANLFVDGNYIYFAADDAAAAIDHGKELWRTDGTTTEFIKDLRAGTSNSTPGNFFSLNNTVYCSAHNGSANVLHSTDGTEVGTLDLGLGYGLFFPKEYNGKIYAIKTIEDNAMYEFDGTTPQRVENNSSIVENVVGGHFTVLNGKAILYMKNNTEDDENIQGTEVGTELYEYDFDTKVYTLIKNIAEDVLYPGEGEVVDINNSTISNIVNLGSKVYFKALNALWETDGTTEGTVAVSGASSITFLNNLYVWNDLLFFEGDNGSSEDQLFAYNPPTNTLTQLSAIEDAGVAKNHDPVHYAEPGDGYLYYTGKNAAGTVLLYRTDGTMVQELYGSEAYYGFDDIVAMNGVLYFEANDGTTGNELYKLDPATITVDDVVTDVEDELYFKNFSIYPNPTDGVINIAGLESVEAVYTLYDIAGRTVQSGVTTSQITLNVAAGIYILEVKDGNYTTTHKVQVK